VRGRVFVVLVSLIAATRAPAEEAPPPGFLEFLGALVERDGELIDPLLWEEALEERPRPADADTEPGADPAAREGAGEEAVRD
jgi:hypothetical protein